MAKNIVKQAVGIDISKNDFKASILAGYIINGATKTKVLASGTFSNNLAGFKKLLQWATGKCKKGPKPIFVMEATGNYYENLALFLHQACQSVNVVLASRAKAFMRFQGAKTKTDKVDAELLGQMGVTQELKPWHLPKKNIYSLRQVVRYLDKLNQKLTVVSNQLHAEESGMWPDSFVVRGLKREIKSLEKEIIRTKAQIDKLIEKSPSLKRKIGYMCSVKGVGVLTAAILVAETNGFALVENARQLASFAGLDVSQNQSGEYQGQGRISKKGNVRLRKALHLPAFVAVRYDVKPLKALFDRLIQKGKRKMKAYVAVQRKLLVLVYTLWKREEHFDPDYYKNLKVSG